MSTRRSRGGSLQEEEPPGQMHEGRRVSVFRESQEAAGAEGKGVVMRSHVRPDPVGLQDVRGG